MRYQVFDGQKPAQYAEGEHRYWKDWSNSIYPTLKEAMYYADSWLGEYRPFYPEHIRASLYKNGYKYNGFDTVQIKEIP